jgi:hypothetical protein
VSKVKPIKVNLTKYVKTEGAYYLDWRTNGVRIRLSVGKNAQDALTQRDRKRFELKAAAYGVKVKKADDINSNGSESVLNGIVC